MSDDIFPTDLAITSENSVQIRWSDGRVDNIPFRILRAACPCATCQTAHEAPVAKPKSLLPVLTPAQARPLTVVRMHPVGQYAYHVEFSDGHSTGIYTFELLRELGRRQR